MEPLMNEPDELEAPGTAGGDGELEPQPSLEERFAALEKELSEEKERNSQALRDWEQRARDAQGWGNEAHMRALSAERALLALQPEAGRQEEQQLVAPDLSEEEMEKFFDDPKVPFAKMKEVAAYIYGRIQRELGPFVSAAMQQAAVYRSSIDLLQEQAVDVARRAAAAKLEMATEEYDALRPAAWNYLVMAARDPRGALDQAKLDSLSINPEAILLAAQRARMDRGVPTAKPALQPTIGKGNQPRREAPPTRNETVSKVEHIFGKKFSDDRLKEVGDRMKELKEYVR